MSEPRYYESEKFLLYLVGSSSDLRTNVWEVTSKCCNKKYWPATTRLSTQGLTCPKCGESETVNYNTLKPKDK